ncbi:hypothetical protein BIW11_03362 [Tropilaelaps mercedesae]|uniref:Uncharacterized protein n=1 Tax=Tropilaelaps mercedesae TaxID=418985 RepID=A0A1V9XMN5_9ACAR|nr:hypothetical protein BIW11_03362 [Tropilaelaps mercedesae]
MAMKTKIEFKKLKHVLLVSIVFFMFILRAEQKTKDHEIRPRRCDNLDGTQGQGCREHQNVQGDSTRREYITTLPRGRRKCVCEKSSHKLRARNSFTGRHYISVVIFAGANRLREVGIMIYGLRYSEVPRAKLRVYPGPCDPTPTADVRLFEVQDFVKKEHPDYVTVSTGIFLPRTSWSVKNLPNRTLIYALLLIDNVEHAEISFKSEARWMEENVPIIGTLPLIELALPGTHQSGAYSPYVGSIFGEQRGMIYCQEEDVFTQLLYGIRALDFRPAAVSKKNSPYNGFEYFIYNGKVPTGNNLETILEDVKNFLELYTKEFIFIDFSEYAVGFDNQEAYDGLDKLVQAKIGRYVFPRNNTRLRQAVEKNLQDLLTGNYRVMLTYANDSKFTANIFPGVVRLWYDIPAAADLRYKLQWELHKERQKYEWFYNAMPQIIPTPSSWWTRLDDKSAGGFRFRFYDLFVQNANLISLDYFTSSDIVELSKLLCTKRAEEKRNRYMPPFK